MSQWYNRPAVMPFGKHRGMPLSAIDTAYLGWLLAETNLRPPLLGAVRGELSRRYQGHHSQRSAPPTRIPGGVDLAVAEELIKAGRRALARVHHPDLGGDASRMTQANATADFLAEALPALLGGKRP